MIMINDYSNDSNHYSRHDHQTEPLKWLFPFMGPITETTMATFSRPRFQNPRLRYQPSLVITLTISKPNWIKIQLQLMDMIVSIESYTIHGAIRWIIYYTWCYPLNDTLYMISSIYESYNTHDTVSIESHIIVLYMILR